MMDPSDTETSWKNITVLYVIRIPGHASSIDLPWTHHILARPIGQCSKGCPKHETKWGNHQKPLQHHSQFSRLIKLRISRLHNSFQINFVLIDDTCCDFFSCMPHWMLYRPRNDESHLKMEFPHVLGCFRYNGISNVIKTVRKAAGWSSGVILACRPEGTGFER